MDAHTYRGSADVALGLVRIVGIPTVIGAVLLCLLIVTIGILTQADAATVLFWAGGLLLIGLVGGFGFMNAFPTIWISEDYLIISAYVNARIAIPWQDIVDVKRGAIPFGGVLVQARRISVFHRLYGWLYSQTLLPSFVISPEIGGYAELVEEIERRVAEGRKGRSS